MATFLVFLAFASGVAFAPFYRAAREEWSRWARERRAPYFYCERNGADR